VDLQQLDGKPLMRARAVQRGLLPQEKPPLETLDYAGDCMQARTIGGDYYDFLDMGPGEVGFVLADIAGKGIAAALLMASLQGSLYSQYSSQHSEGSKDISQCAVLSLSWDCCTTFSSNAGSDQSPGSD
jgi:serine phosphatase RsbU (regulator of sigma subunit)